MAAEGVSLAPYARGEHSAIRESSGLVKSRRWPDLFWTLNDSGNAPKIYPVKRNGTHTPRGKSGDGGGIEILGARNIDWEDIACDDKGNVIIGDFGNNSNKRRDLVLYVVKEPNPFLDTSVEVSSKIPFHYPDQNAFPPKDRNFDAEALFWARGHIYILTKHRSDTFTKLYRLDSLSSQRSMPLTLLDGFDIKGMVTAADASPDGDKLAVLTYNAVWLFESKVSDRYFSGKASWLPIRAKQCEGICFDGDRLIISNEQRDLYEIPLSALIPRE